ncbi:MAG TPA: tetratricopeptide repeat protein [Bryobacteraceae bacterium]|nr:tetratricopeptide repeat protein [Bryobacteraceae bacterium]
MTPATRLLPSPLKLPACSGGRASARAGLEPRSFCLLLLLTLPLLAADSLTERGVAAFQQGHYLESSRLLQDALKADPNDDHARTFLALSRAATGHCTEAIADLADRFEKSANPDLSRLAGLALAQCYVTEGQCASALPIAVRLEQKYPDDADVLYQAARVHMKAFNDVTRRMFEKTPASYRVNQLSAEIFETQNRFTEAAAEYRKAIAKNPRALNLHFRLGRALLLESHDPEALALAEKEFEAELALNAGDAAAEFQIGQILNTGSKADQALPHFQKALDLSPDFAEAALAVGKLRVQAKQYAEAIPLLEHVVALEPRNEPGHYTLMLAYRNSGQMDKARREQEVLQKLQHPPEGEFTDFLKRLGEGTPAK